MKDKDNKYYKGSFKNKECYIGFVFNKSDKELSSGGKPYWEYTCPVCSSDEYVQNGLCSGVFTSTSSSLCRGSKGCRCGGNYYWTKEQREYQIQKICKKEGFIFIGWVDGYKNADSKIVWMCNNGHIRSNFTVARFRSRSETSGIRCICSAENIDGYYSARSGEMDTCYLLHFTNPSTGEKFIKIGRSFVNNYKGRLQYFRKYYNVVEISTNTDIHDVIHKMEKQFHIELNKFLYKPSIFFKGSIEECFTMEVLTELNIT